MTQKLLIRDLFAPPNDDPAVVSISYSAGAQSQYMIEMVLTGHWERPKNLIVVAADPGNEHIETYRLRDETFERLRNADIPCVVAPGPKMLDELLNTTGRLDTPAQWTENGGQIGQCCTRHYKIRPIRRAVIAFAREVLGRYHIETHEIETWIGFGWDERHRVKLNKDDHRFQHRYPMIDRQITRDDVADYFGDREPVRSVCNHCWANSVKTFRRIRDTDPRGWELACQYDDAARDLSRAGVKEKTFCSRTLIPLRELADMEDDDVDDQSCDDGYCFL